MIADLKPYAEYKESGLPWLGQVPGHWDVRKPRHIGSLLKGVGGTKEDALSAGVPCVRYGEIYTTHTFFVRKPKAFIHPDRASDYTPLHYGDVLFAASGETLEEIGKSAVNLIEGTAVCGGDVIILRPTVPVHAPFLGYVMDCRPSANQKATMGRGTTVKHIYPDELKQLLLPFPPVSEQAAIVRFLDWANGRLERAIRAKRKVIALLNEQKQAIIHRAVTRGLDPSVPLKPSGIPWLGDIPQHWRASRLSQLSTRIGDGLHGTPQYVDQSPYYFINGNNLVHGEIRLKSSTRCVSEDEFGKYMIALDDTSLLMSINGTIGSVACYRGESIILGKSAAYINCGKDLARPFLFSFLRSPAVINFLRQEVTGTTIFNLSLASIRSLAIALPPLDEQCKIASAIEDMTAPVGSGISRLEREIELLREYRTRLVADVVTGKLDVREAAARLPDEAPLDTVDDDTDLSDETEAADEEAAA